MKAIIYESYGGPEVLQLRETEKPAVKENTVLVKVKAAAANPLDWHYLRGAPLVLRLMSGLTRPKRTGLGADMAGVIEEVGPGVTDFAVGDEVYGVVNGAFAEYVRASRSYIAHKPSNLSFEQAAAIPIAALTAFQGLRDHGRLESGQSVLINGASGGVGTFAVQIAKALGADVTGVCSGRNIELVQSLGADRVIDYTGEDFTIGTTKYDLIIDNVGSKSLRACRRVLKPKGRFIGIGADASSSGPIGGLISMLLYSPFVSQKMAGFMAKPSGEDLRTLNEMFEQGKVQPVIEKRYPLAEVPAAIRHLETGRVRGKLVIVP
ncbi:NAD(P)-dependent alcohol dehydrogenase [bacterium]|nr:NAD(P)-dependent alcohol dehydrogenase [bacterium]MCB2201956.1 NAD(P)-dependent alcohol dehydrogenase [bacterium]